MSVTPPPDPALQKFNRLRRYFRNERAPWSADAGAMTFLTTAGGGAPGDIHATRQAFGDALRARFADALRDDATDGLAEREPQASAKSIQMRIAPPMLVIILAVVAAALAAPGAALTVLSIISAAFFLALALARLGLMTLAAAGEATPRRRAVPDHALPVVTILAPLFREAHALPGLLQAIGHFDYPKEKLDVKLLLEEGDVETIAEARRLAHPGNVELIVTPPSHPQTKPKACNYGLHCARGDLIVIYDAEDEPEADQLRLAAETFLANGDELACVQAKLNFYNADENWLTRLFTLEYCLWFDHFLPALDRIGAPVPLGGTSNIFRTEILAEIGGWDPHNVTEDADIGLRLARRGYRTAIIASTTFEEANCRFGNWMRQRTRWMKGFLQTWLVHRRDMKGCGWRGVLSVDLFIGGAVFAALATPIIWFALGVMAFAPAEWAANRPFSAAIGAATLTGNIIFMAIAAIAPLKRGHWRLCPSALLVPIYWLMVSFAAWRGVIQLARRPAYWEKTEHGLSADAKSRRAAALDALGLD